MGSDGAAGRIDHARVAEPGSVRGSDDPIDVETEKSGMAGDRLDRFRLHAGHADTRQRPLPGEGVEEPDERIVGRGPPRHPGKIGEETERDVDGVMR